VLENWRSMENSMCWEKSKIYGAYGHDIHDSSWFTKKKTLRPESAVGSTVSYASTVHCEAPFRGIAKMDL
jgi:hypothetical protein